MDDLKIASVSMQCLPGEIAKNLAKIRELCLEASGRGTDIVCLPELSVTGYVLDRPGDIYGPEEQEYAMDSLVRIAAEASTVVLGGLIELDGSHRPYLSHAAAAPGGLMGLYRKTHLSPQEKQVFQAGSELPLFSLPTAAFGILLCYEAHFPEISTVLALKGADILFVPHASPRGSPDSKYRSWMRHLRARAFDNGVYVAACNQAGDSENGLSFPGASVVLGPDGRTLDRYTGGSENILYTELRASQLRDVREHRMKYFLPERRPELYGEIAAQEEADRTGV